jgi:2-polyprenyl-3-methyl-5-hydroxy-6-metoxy-1,4-benzoquinol methylase
MAGMSEIAPAAVCPSAPDGRCAFGLPRSFRDRSGKVGAVSVLQCRHCGLGITQPPIADVTFLYEARESQDFQPTSVGLARRIKKIAFRRDARRLLKQIGRRPERVLDFGCGSGQFTRCLADVLPESFVLGSDFHDEPPAELASRPYVPNARLDADPADFDLVIAMHVIEHDDDPVGLVRQIVSRGASGSTFVFEVPNVDCAWAGVFGEAWDAWYVPFHRIHFTRASLRSVLERNGLAIEREIDVCLPSMGRTLANLLGSRNSLPLLLAGIVLHPLQWIVEQLTGRPSALRVIARKA